MGRKLIVLDQEKYNRLKPVEYYALQQKWLCQCDCGKYTYAKAHAIKSGRVKSCGCWKIEQNKTRKKIDAET